MRFPFKHNETVRVEVIHPVILCGEIRHPGFRADVIGRLAMQMMGHARPMVKLVEDFEPVRHEPIPPETPVEVADPLVETRDPAVQIEEEKLAQFHKDAANKAPRRRKKSA